MTVQLDANGRPLAFGADAIDGEDIPDPPTTNPPHEYRWDGSAWIHDPPVEPDLTTLTDDEIANRVEAGKVSVREVVLFKLRNGGLKDTLTGGGG